MKYVFYIFVLLCGLLPGVTFAQSDTFRIRALVGEDTTPPAMPVITSATPVSADQITVVWLPTSDDVLVAGYRVFRDATQIATTTLTTFADTGLQPETLYTYTVDAFDYSDNISSTSVPVATTTFAVPVVPPVTPTSTDDRSTSATAVPVLRYLEHTATAGDITLRFAGYGPTRYTIRFGRTSSYELGTVFSDVYQQAHTALLSGLEPGTVYEIEISLRNGFGIERVVATERIVTGAPVVSTVLPSVTGLVATWQAAGVRLVWQTPVLLPTQRIRVVRSPLFYPQNPYDGVIVYEGTGQSLMDSRVSTASPIYYYSVFIVDDEGRFSAPAVVRVVRQRGDDVAVVPPATEGEVLPPLGTSTAPDRADLDQVTPQGLYSLAAEDVLVTFLGRTITLAQLHDLPLAAPVLVSIPRAAIPSSLKSVLLTVSVPPRQQETTYLLKLNAAGEAYEVAFYTSAIAGEGKFIIEVFDYEYAVLRRFTTSVTYSQVVTGSLTVSSYVYWLGGGTSIVLLLGGGLWWWGVRRSRREDN